jgi:3-oxoacyl-[acyl-carrier protein] reductase
MTTNGRTELESLLSVGGKVVLVAGGSGDIGRAIVRLYRQAGARVLTADLPGRAPEDTNDAPATFFIPCDISKPDQVRALLERVESDYGRLDVLIHSAGITRDRVLWKMNEEEWSTVLNVNLDSAFYLLRAAVPLLRKTGGGAVVLVSSITAQRGKFGQANYAASKAGMIALGKTAALELGRFGIRVNAVAPAWIETRMTSGVPDTVRQHELENSPLGRLGQPDDVARVVLFLGSDMSRHVNGQVIRVDGGQVMA